MTLEETSRQTPKLPEIRISAHGDAAAIESLYRAAFPDEDLIPLVRDLLCNSLLCTSLVAALDTNIIGHAIFNQCQLAEPDVKISLLGPLAIHPDCQKQGYGSAIVKDGLVRLKQTNTAMVCVLGDPEYYRRFGFMAESHILPPFELPDKWASAWQSLATASKPTGYSGTLQVPEPWNHPQFWS